MRAACGPLEDDEREAATDLLKYSFPDNKDLEQRVKSEPQERTFAVREKGDLVAVILFRKATILSERAGIPIAISGPGATAPAFRNRGLQAEYQEQLILAMRASGCILSGLETPITRWHVRNGWGVSSAVARFLGAPASFAPIGQAGPGEPVLNPPRDAVLQLYAASAGRRFGMLARDASAWGDPPASPAGALRTDVVGWREGESDWTGYCAFTHVRQEDGRLGIILNELMTVSPAAWRGLLLFLSTHNNVASIRWDAPGDEPLASVVREPRELEIKVCLDKMVRVLDVAELKFCCESDSRCPQGLTIGIHDRQAPWNDGRWRVEPAAGSRYALSREEGDIADASCEIAACDLGPIISGYLSIDGAVRAGLVKVSDDGAARQLRALFTRERAPYCPDNW